MPASRTRMTAAAGRCVVSLRVSGSTWAGRGWATGTWQTGSWSGRSRASAGWTGDQWH
jgi:hypothetical protein